jgi:hypothetical protein
MKRQLLFPIGITAAVVAILAYARSADAKLTPMPPHVPGAPNPYTAGQTVFVPVSRLPAGALPDFVLLQVQASAIANDATEYGVVVKIDRTTPASVVGMITGWYTDGPNGFSKSDFQNAQNLVGPVEVPLSAVGGLA